MGTPVKMKATAADRPGFQYRFGAGAARPGKGIAVPRGAGNFLEFYVVDSAKCPEEQIDGILTIGQEALKELDEDPEIFVFAADALQASNIAAQSKAKDDEIAALKAQLAALQAAPPADPKAKK